MKTLCLSKNEVTQFNSLKKVTIAVSTIPEISGTVLSLKTTIKGKDAIALIMLDEETSSRIQNALLALREYKEPK